MGSLKVFKLSRISHPVGIETGIRRPTSRRQTFGAANVRCMSAESLPTKSLVFLGTPNVAADVLESLLDASQVSSDFEVTAVVTQPPSMRARGRRQLPSPVEQRALELKFPAARIFSPLKAGEDGFLEELKKLKPDLCVTAAYGNILPKKFLAVPTCGTVNVHPSLLPLYRGAAPVQRALQDGVKISGVTIAYTVRALDAGPIIASESMDVDGEVKAPELLSVLFQRGSALLLKELPSILDGTAKMNAVEQDEARATSAPKITVEEAWLDFEQTAELLHNKVRAFAEWPGCRATFCVRSSDEDMQSLELKVVTTRIGTFRNGGGGEVALVKDALVVQCGGDSFLEILHVQPPSKKVMGARDFCNGLRGQTLSKSVTLQPDID